MASTISARLAPYSALTHHYQSKQKLEIDSATSSLSTSLNQTISTDHLPHLLIKALINKIISKQPIDQTNQENNSSLGEHTQVFSHTRQENGFLITDLLTVKQSYNSSGSMLQKTNVLTIDKTDQPIC